MLATIATTLFVVAMKTLVANDALYSMKDVLVMG